MKRLTCFLILLSFFSLSNSLFVQAVETKTIEDLKGDLPTLSHDSIPVTIGKVVTFILGFVGALAVLMIIVGGVMYIVSKGDRGMMETAQSIITWAVVGLIIALLGWVIINSIITNLGGSGGGESKSNEPSNDYTDPNYRW